MRAFDCRSSADRRVAMLALSPEFRDCTESLGKRVHAADRGDMNEKTGRSHESRVLASDINK